MQQYSFKGSPPTHLPHRIKLSNGLTRTDPSTFTAEEIADAGYTPVPDPPHVQPHQVLLWSSDTSTWLLRDKTDIEIQAELNQKWTFIRQQRDKLIADVAWRYERYNRHVRLNIPPVDDIQKLDTYVEALANIPQTQTDPDNIIWPHLNGELAHTDPDSPLFGT